jgi:hypothetical protein
MNMFRLIDYYLLLVMNKRLNFLIYYRKRHIIQCQMVIFGFRFFQDHHQYDLHVLNVVHAVLSYY